MTRDQLLERARRSHRLAVLHRGLRDVSAEVTDVRESLSAAGSQPAAIGVTEAELTELVRSGFLAEARITFELAADRGSSPAERDFLFTDLVAQITRALKLETPVPADAKTPAEEPTISDDEAARLLEEHDPSKGLVPWDVARNSGEFAAVTGEDIEALNFDAFDAAPPVILAAPLPPNDPGPFIELESADLEDEYPEITIETVSIAPESLMPDPPPAAEPALGPEAVRMAVRFFGEKGAAELGCVPDPAGEPVLLTNVIRQGTIPPPSKQREEDAPAAEATA